MNKIYEIPVSLGERSHQIFIGCGLLPSAGVLWRRQGLPKKAVIITNPGIKTKYGLALQKSLEKSGVETVFIIVPAGEKFKVLATVSIIYDLLVELKIERHDAIIALGGGVIGDLAGFVAATYLRGIAFVQVPTTLLAQVDSAIGGKVGVNHPQGKNLIGVFYQPKMILIDLETLASLPIKERRSGLAEVVKYGMIGNAGFFKFLEKSVSILKKSPDFSDKKQADVYRKIISICAGIKARVIEKDEKEKKLRMILNFGHTIGHGIEAAGDYKKYTHGQAVALGMLGATLIAIRCQLVGEPVLERLKRLLKNLGLPVVVTGLNPARVYAALQLDKKIKDKKIRLVLPQKIGRVTISENINPWLIQGAIGELLFPKGGSSYDR